MPSLLDWSGVECKSWQYKINQESTKSGADLFSQHIAIESNAMLETQHDSLQYRIQTQKIQNPDTENTEYGHNVE